MILKCILQSGQKYSTKNQMWLFQKQPFADVLQNTCSQKFRKILRKTPVLEFLFNKVTGLSSNNIAKISSYGLQISSIEIKHLFHFKAYFHVFDTFHKKCLSTWKDKL